MSAHPMKILIWGFSTIEEIDGVMQGLIAAEKIPMLFYILSTSPTSTAAQWGERVGLPVLKIGFEGSKFNFLEGDKKLEYLARSADYLVLKDKGGPVGRRVLMMMKSLEKHGTIVKA